jgi:hypothetical protein
MKILLTVKGEEGGEGEGGEGEGELEGEEEDDEVGEGGVESGRERMVEVNEERDEEDNEEKNEENDYEQKIDDEGVEEVGESEFDDVAKRGLHTTYTDSRTRNESKINEMPPDILLQPAGIGIGKLTHHNLTNVHGHVPVHVRACKKKEGADGLEFNVESCQIKNKNEYRNENKSRIGNRSGVKCTDGKADHIAVLVTTKNKLKLNTTNNVIKNHFNPTVVHDKSLISLNNNLKFIECSLHLKACSESMINLKALIEKDVLNLSLVVHEPEIWRR